MMPADTGAPGSEIALCLGDSPCSAEMFDDTSSEGVATHYPGTHSAAGPPASAVSRPASSPCDLASADAQMLKQTSLPCAATAAAAPTISPASTAAALPCDPPAQQPEEQQTAAPSASAPAAPGMSDSPWPTPIRSGASAGVEASATHSLSLSLSPPAEWSFDTGDSSDAAESPVLLAPLGATDNLYLRELAKSPQKQRHLEWCRFVHVTRSGRQLGHVGVTGKEGVEPWHRVVCIDWMSEVCSLFHLGYNTLSRGVAMFDDAVRLLAPRRGKLQLYSITALAMAAKIEERQTINLQNYAEMTCGVCTATDLMVTEMTILKACGFNAMPPSVHDYLPSLLSLLDLNDAWSVSLCNYLSEVVLYSTECAALPPSSVAVAVVSMATSAKYDKYLVELSKFLFGADTCWEVCNCWSEDDLHQCTHTHTHTHTHTQDARAPAVQALEDCHIDDFKSTVKPGGAAEMSLSTKVSEAPSM